MHVGNGYVQARLHAIALQSTKPNFVKIAYGVYPFWANLYQFWGL